MLAEWARGADVLLCECSLPSEMAIKEHLTPEQCGALAAAALPKHLVLTHMYPPVERPTLRATIAAHYAGPITIAHDGAAFEIEEG
jgi:ribonuclease BN (tRNA processing enzyme)